MKNRPVLVCAIVLVLLLGISGLLVISGGTGAVGSFTTSLDGRSGEQMHNIRLAAGALDGVILRPGEVFSFSKAVGACTTDRGYVKAPVIVEGELEDEAGGGICQVSSTLYNAALLAGLEVVERYPHSSPVSSVPPGRDATVVDGGLDLKFRNTLPEPVRVKADISGSRLVMRIVGRRVSTSVYRIVTENRGTPKHGPASDMRAGRSCVATVWREEVRNGKVIVREFISSDVYVISPGS